MMKKPAIILLVLLLTISFVSCKADKINTDYVTQIDISTADSTAQETYEALTSGIFYAMSRSFYLSELTKQEIPLISIGGGDKCAVFQEKSSEKFLYLHLEAYTLETGEQEWIIHDVRYMETLYPSEKLDKIWNSTEGMPLPTGTAMP